MSDEPENIGEDMDDLESQLAALGLLGDDESDTDSSDIDALLGGGDLDSLLASMGDGDDDAFAMLEALGEGGSGAPESVPMSSVDDAMDLDKQLELLLNADQIADESFDVNAMSVSTPVQDTYDADGGYSAAVQYVKGSFVVEDDTPKSKLFENISVWKMLATAGIGVLFVVVGAFSAIFITLAVREQEQAIAAVSNFIPIELPTDVANNANFVFVNQPMFLNERLFTLNRISAGNSGTFFYFDENFNTDDYIIFLYNQARHLYPITTFNIQASRGAGTVLQFDALTLNTLFLSLHIQCRATNEFISFDYRFLSRPIHAPGMYLTRGVYAAGYEGFSGVMIRHATFDNASSQIHYSFESAPISAGFRRNPNAEGSFVTLTDLFSTINNLTNGTTTAYYENFGTTIGSATFGAVMGLENPINVNFNGLRFYYPNPSFSVTPRDLFDNDQDNPFAIQTGPFTLNLEGMAQQGNFLVLVLHGLDERGQRRETVPSMTMRVSTDSGFVNIPGVTHSSPRGSDVVFDLQPYINELRNIPISRYSLIIHYVEYDVPQVSVPIQLNKFNNLPSARRVSAEMAITESILSLLSYKSGNISINNLVGVSSLVRFNEETMSIFAPTSTQVRPMYNATVVTGDLLNNYDYVAIVEVQWVAGVGADMEYFHGILQVTARSSDAIWSVTEIRLI